MYSSADIIDAWRNYGIPRAKYPTLWDGSVACAFGPLGPEGLILHDHSGRTAGTAWSVGAGDVPKYTQGSYRGQAFWAGRYDGSNDYTTIGHQDFLNPGTGAFSISAWIKPTLNSYGPVVQKRNADGGITDVFSLSVGDNTYLGTAGNKVGLLLIFNGTGNARGYDTASDVLDGTDKNIVTTWDGSSIAIYVNGIQHSLVERMNAGSVSDLSPSGPVRIGTNNASANFYAGEIGPLMLHRRVLTANEIAALARHPLAAYEVNVPRYWMFSAASGARFAPWILKTRRQRTGA